MERRPLAIQNEGVRTLLPLAPLVLASTAACAGPVAATRMESREVIAVDSTPPPVEPASTSRPRLSRTITLGQDSETYAYSAPVAPAPPPAAAAPTVIVNNQTNVMVGGGYGYGYGGPTYGYFPRSSGFRSSGFAGGTSTGWEGARRTAAPGQTPPIGGNWPTIPSYGPAPMR
jgi:hypothetical protein